MLLWQVFGAARNSQLLIHIPADVKPGRQQQWLKPSDPCHLVGEPEFLKMLNA